MRIKSMPSAYPLENLVLPLGRKRLLLHICCAPCSASILETLQASHINFSLFFYNPNIYPKKEYIKRKQEVMHFAEKLNVPCIDADYDIYNWFARTKGMAHEPERGKRCSVCFNIRFESASLYAHNNGYDTIATSLGISRWKNLQQIVLAGNMAVAKYPDLIFWDYNWRKKGGSNNMVNVSKREKFYRQTYCGCIYSLRDTNKILL